MAYSVLMSVYYKEKADNLEAAIKSMLEQTVPPSDFVIVCDGALTDELDAVIADFERDHPDLANIVRIPENRHLGNALRTGITACKHSIIARMDSDDISLPDRMEKQLPYFDDPEIAVVGGQICEFCSTDESIHTVRRVPLTHEQIVKTLKSRNPMNHVSTVFRKEPVLEVGSYEEIQRFEDYWLWARLILAGYKLMNIDKICVNVRTDGMFERRKGKDFFNGAMTFWKKMYRSRLISFPRYQLNLCIWFFATMCVNNKLMSSVYRRFLRENHSKKKT